MRRRRKVDKRSLAIIAVLLLLVGLGFMFLFVNLSFVGQKSLHEDALTYKTRHCMAFYPDSSDGKEMARSICKGVKDDSIHDYTLIPYGDYYLVSYGGDKRYFADHDYHKVIISDVADEGRKIIADYIRYTFKKDRPEQYYNAEFLKSLQADKIDFSQLTYDIDGEYLLCHVPQYEMDVSVPLKYLQKALDMNCGYPYEMYRKPVYLDPSEDHPVICLTFDDGPFLWDDLGTTSTEAIIDVLYDYDACGTFYFIGNMMEDRDIWADFQVYTLIKHSIGNGNEYGSHTQSHRYNLTDLSDPSQIYEEINGPIAYMKEFMDYEVRTYRPVEGAFNDTVLQVQPVPAILWDVDSEDWYSRDPDDISAMCLKYEYESGDIVIFHDIYNETAQALEKTLPEMVDRGYQLVSVSDMLRYLNIDPAEISYFYGPDYYE